MVLVACSATPAASSTTTAPPVPVASSVRVEETTTTTVPTTTTEPAVSVLGVRPLGPGYPLAAGRTFLWDLGVVPVELEFEQPGWELIISFERGFGLINDADELASTDQVFAGIATRPRATAEELAAEFLESSRTIDSTPGVSTEFGGAEAIVFDVLSLNTFTNAEVRCSGHVVDQAIDPSGRGIQNTLVGCAWTRVWLVEVGSDTLVVTIADAQYDMVTPDDPIDYPTIESIAPLVAEFEAAITIGD